MNEELKPCPFCGGTNMRRIMDFDDYDAIRCDQCGARSSRTEEDEKANILWNTRPIEDALTARLREAEAEIAALRERAERAEADAERRYKQGRIDGLQISMSILWGATPKQMCLDKISEWYQTEVMGLQTLIAHDAGKDGEK